MLIKFEIQIQLTIIIIIGAICQRSQELLDRILNQQGITQDSHGSHEIVVE